MCGDVLRQTDVKVHLRTNIVMRSTQNEVVIFSQIKISHRLYNTFLLIPNNNEGMLTKLAIPHTGKGNTVMKTEKEKN